MLLAIGKLYWRKIRDLFKNFMAMVILSTSPKNVTYSNWLWACCMWPYCCLYEEYAVLRTQIFRHIDSKPGWSVIQLIICPGNSCIVAVTAFISLQHLFSATVGMKSQLLQVHLKQGQINFLYQICSYCIWVYINIIYIYMPLIRKSIDPL